MNQASRDRDRLRRDEQRWLLALILCAIPLPYFIWGWVPLVLLIGCALVLNENENLAGQQQDDSVWRTPVERWASRPGRTGLEPASKSSW